MIRQVRCVLQEDRLARQEPGRGRQRGEEFRHGIDIARRHADGDRTFHFPGGRVDQQDAAPFRAEDPHPLGRDELHRPLGALSTGKHVRHLSEGIELIEAAAQFPLVIAGAPGNAPDLERDGTVRSERLEQPLGVGGIRALPVGLCGNDADQTISHQEGNVERRPGPGAGAEEVGRPVDRIAGALVPV